MPSIPLSMEHRPPCRAVRGTTPAASDAPASSRFAIRRIGIALAAWEPPVDFLLEQLESIHRQTWSEWICIITCDSPLRLLREDRRLAPFFGSPRFVWMENERRLGHLRNFEKAIRACVHQGVDAIACSDQDDVWDEEKLAVLAAELSRCGRLALVHSDMRCLGPDAREVQPGQRTVWQHERRHVAGVRPEQLMVRNVVSGCSVLFDAELARRYPDIPPGVRYHDQWLAILAACHGGVHAVPRPLMHYRQHGANAVGLRSSGTAWRSLLRSGLGAWVRDAVALWRDHVLLGASMGKLGLGSHIPAVGRVGGLRTWGGIWRDEALLRNLTTLWVGAVVAAILPAKDA